MPSDTIKTFGDWWRYIKRKGITVKIPDYQRSYSWEKRQVETLLEDLISETDSNFYFLGMFLYEKSNNGKTIELIDGQQRFTTLAMILHVLGEDIKNGKNHILKLQTINNSDFRDIISKEITARIKANKSSERLRRAYNYIESFFVDGAGNGKNDIVRKKIMNSDIHTYEATGKNDIARTNKAMYIFELLNDRGKSLSSLETIKASAMYNNPDDAKDDLDQIKLSFAKINTYFEEISQKIDDDSDAILRWHYIAYFSVNPKKYSIDNVRFNLKKEIANSKSPVKIIKEIEQTFKFFSEILQTIHNGEKSWLRCLFMHKRMAHFYPLLIKINDIEKVQEISNFLELYVFKTFILSNRNSNKDLERFYRLANNYDEQNNINGTKIEILKLISKNSDDQTNNNVLDDDKFYEKHHRLEMAIILLSYDIYCGEIDKKLKPSKEIKNSVALNDIINAKKADFLTTEHIYPQNPGGKKGDHLYQTKVENDISNFLENRGLNHDDFQEGFLHSLGNLVISRKGANSSYGNKLPEDKIIEGYDFGSSQIEVKSMIEDSKKKYFTKAHIKKRKDNIKQFILNRWFNIDYASNEESKLETFSIVKGEKEITDKQEIMKEIENREVLI